MSLIQHVTVEEGTDRVEDPDRDAVSIFAGIEGIDRRLSFNPLSHPEDLEPIQAITSIVGSHFVSKRLRIGMSSLGDDVTSVVCRY
jgi:hypothetical protein